MSTPVRVAELGSGPAAAPRQGRKPWYFPTGHEALVHATMMATLLWVGAGLLLLSGTGDKTALGGMKWADYSHFYTLGAVAASGTVEALYDRTTLHAVQAALVPDSSPDWYLAVYPPQTALFFAPLSRLPYQQSALVWVLAVACVYCLVVYDTWKHTNALVPYRRLVAACALAFPPVWYLILHGQNSVLVLAAYWGAWRCLERRHLYLAGMAFGCLALKPQFIVPIGAVLLFKREWKPLVGMMLSGIAQVAVTSAVLGPWLFIDFIRSIPGTVAQVDLMEPNPFMSHSLRAVTRLLPSVVGTPSWLLIVLAIMGCLIKAWSSTTLPLRLKMGVLVVASLLVNPHVIVYDAIVLVLPLLWLADWVCESGERWDLERFGLFTYALFGALLLPTARAVGVQLSVVLMVWMLIVLTRGRTTFTLSTSLGRVRQA